MAAITFTNAEWYGGPLANSATVASTSTMPQQSQYWSVPVVLTPLLHLDRSAFDRLMLARVGGAAVAHPLRLRVSALDRRPTLVRRSPRPAGRPAGWRRRRKGGRIL